MVRLSGVVQTFQRLKNWKLSGLVKDISLDAGGYMPVFNNKAKHRRIILSIIAFIVISFLVFGSSVYAKNTLNTSELVHFFVPFPAGKVVKPNTVTTPTGEKIFVRPITINVNNRGILKRILNPAIEGLSTHWLTNIDTKPHRIGMKFTNINIPVDWEVGAAIPWDPVTKTFSEAIGPGESIKDLGVDWLFHFSEEVRSQPVWYDGTLVVFDADTNEVLTIIPVKFTKGGTNESTGRPKTS